MRSLLIAWLLSTALAASAAEHGMEPPQHDEFEVGAALGIGEQSGIASATVRIHATREVVWSLVTSCAESLTLVPGLVSCKVLETAPDRSWQRIRQVMDYSWYAPRLTYEIRASYEQPSRVSIERISGDLRVLKGSWVLQEDGDYTIAHYVIDLVPGFWVPHWMVRAALLRDLPKMLRELRARAESLQLNRGP